MKTCMGLLTVIRAFSVATSRAWNRLPTELKLMLSSMATFRRHLKSFLFRTAYWLCNAPLGCLWEAHYKFCCYCYWLSSLPLFEWDGTSIPLYGSRLDFRFSF